MSASGRVDLGDLVLLAIVAAVIYFGVLLAPVMVDHINVKGQISRALKRAHALDDEQLRIQVARELSRVGEHYRLNPYGELEEAPGLGIVPEQVVVDRNTVTQTIRMSLPYQRQIRLKPTQKFITLRFKPEREHPIGR